MPNNSIRAFSEISRRERERERERALPKIQCTTFITGDHSKQDQILLVKIDKYIGFCVYRRSYLLSPPVIEGPLPLSRENDAEKRSYLTLCGLNALFVTTTTTIKHIATGPPETLSHALTPPPKPYRVPLTTSCPPSSILRTRSGMNLLAIMYGRWATSARDGVIRRSIALACVGAAR